MRIVKRRVVTALSTVAVAAVPGAVVANAAPLPDSCVPATVVDGVCTARLTSVTADVVDGTITGTPVGGGAPIMLTGQQDAYLKSAGFVPMPDTVRQWDSEIDRTADLDVDPSNPAWYGNAKARVFLPRTLNDVATRFPPDSLVVRFTSGDASSGAYQLVSIQPTPRP